MTDTVLRTPNWWDDIGEPLIQPAQPARLLDTASDRLALAAITQTESGHHGAIAAMLGQWSIDLRQRNPDLATVVSVLLGLDRLDRQECEPQTWHHLKAAEGVVAAYVAREQGG